MTDDTDSDTFSEVQRQQAYSAAFNAKQTLEDAARHLGYDSIHEMMDDRADGGFDRSTDDGIRAMTNAYSYLDNGMLEGLLDPIEDDD
jgi:hypothetical protein